MLNEAKFQPILTHKAGQMFWRNTGESGIRR